MGLRSAVALHQGVEEDALVAAAATGSVDGIEERHQAALRIADAYLGAPAHIGEVEWTALTAVLAPEAVAEIALWLSKCSRNKVRVSLGFDLEDVRRQVY